MMALADPGVAPGSEACPAWSMTKREPMSIRCEELEFPLHAAAAPPFRLLQSHAVMWPYALPWDRHEAARFHHRCGTVV
jgi:hypothetical protein